MKFSWCKYNSLTYLFIFHFDFGVKCGCCGRSSLFVHCVCMSDVSTVPHQGASMRCRLLSSEDGEVRCLYRPRGPQLISFEYNPSSSSISSARAKRANADRIQTEKQCMTALQIHSFITTAVVMISGIHCRSCCIRICAHAETAAVFSVWLMHLLF